MNYYHITNFTNVPNISKEGLKGNGEGEIFVFDTDDHHLLSYASEYQLGLADFGLFKIHSSGITGKVERDNVGELTARHQFIIHQELIESRYIEFIGMKKSIFGSDPQKLLQYYLQMINKMSRG